MGTDAQRGESVVALSYRAKIDQARYHPENPADYGSPIGMPYRGEDGKTYFACVGCWYCCPEAGDIGVVTSS